MNKYSIYYKYKGIQSARVYNADSYAEAITELLKEAKQNFETGLTIIEFPTTLYVCVLCGNPDMDRATMKNFTVTSYTEFRETT